MRLWMIVAFFFVIFSTSTFSAKLEKVHIAVDNATQSIFLQVTGNDDYRSYVLHNPERIVVDLYKTTLNCNLQKVTYPHNLIVKLRSGSPYPNTLRIVFDMAQSVQISTEKINTHRGYGIGIKINAKGSEQKTMKPFANINNRPLRDVVVIIDPGHGGKDPGAIGVHNSKEKNIVLDIARKLKKRIDSQPGMRAVLTRNGDYYIGLRQRLDIARKHDGDVFVAIHADAFGNHASHGASVFALSQSGATSEAARWLAEKENYSELGGVDLSSLDDKNNVIRTVLIDLSQTATISASLNMGRDVLNNLKHITALHSYKVEQARFVVLKSPDIPSVLVETGFVSNPREEKNLTSNYYQDRISLAIFKGIKSYFWSYPPYGSLIEAMVMDKRKIAKAGRKYFVTKRV